MHGWQNTQEWERPRGQVEDFTVIFLKSRRNFCFPAIRSGSKFIWKNFGKDLKKLEKVNSKTLKKLEKPLEKIWKKIWKTFLKNLKKKLENF